MSGESIKPSSSNTIRIDRGRVTRALGLVAGSFAAGSGAGVAASKLSSGEAVLPLRSFEWILEHGMAGLLLVLVFVVGYALRRKDQEVRDLHEQRERDQEARYKERIEFEKAARDKVEQLLREQVKTTRTTSTLVAQTNDLLRSLNLVVEETETEEGVSGGDGGPPVS
jgi:uncharacterized protein YaiL (DUF2058 family)